MNKNILLGVVVLIALFSVASCSHNNESYEEKTASFASEFYFYKSDYDEKYNEINKELLVKKDSEVLVISGSTNSGDIDVNVLYGDEIKASYSIDELTKEYYEIKGFKEKDWSVNIKINELTEGNIKIEVR